MAKSTTNSVSNSGTKGRGRTSITGTSAKASGKKPASRPAVPVTVKAEASRPVKAGSGKLRGDRRDMSKTYSGTKKHASRGSDERPDVKTRKR